MKGVSGSLKMTLSQRLPTPNDDDIEFLKGIIPYHEKSVFPTTNT